MRVRGRGPPWARYSGFAHMCETLWTRRSGGRRQRERQHRGGARPAQLAAGDGHRPAGVGEVVHEQHRRRHRRPAARAARRPTTIRSHTAASRKALLPPGCPVGPPCCRDISPRYGSRPSRASPCARPVTSCGRRRDGMATTAPGRSFQSQDAEHPRARLQQRRRPAARRRPSAAPARRRPRPGPPRCRAPRGRATTVPPTPSSPSRVRRRCPQPRSVSRATARPVSSWSDGAILPFTSTPSRSAPVGHCARGASSTPGPVERGRRRLGGRLRHVGGVPGAGADVAPAAGRGGRVVERLLQEGHPALGLVDRPRVGDHRPLLGLARARDAGVPVGVVDPRLPGRPPAALHPLDRAVDGEHLEQQLQPGPADVGHGLQPGHRPRLAVGHRGRARRRRGPPAAWTRWRTTARSRGPPGPGSSSTSACSTARPARPTCW